MSAPAVIPFALALAAGCGDYTAYEDIIDPSLKLVWSSEFNGAAGAPPNPAQWAFDVGGEGWGNNQKEFDTDRPDNVRLDGDGHLAIVARAEKYQNRSFTSGRIKTKGLYAHMYGRIEARIKLPAGRGIWPAFWALGDDIDQVSWPQCGEIDIMEASGSEPTINHGSLHGPGYSGGGALTRAYALPGGARFADDFHVFAIDWSERGIRWLIDNRPYATQLPTSVPPGREWVYDHPFFLLLNVAVGGNFVGDPDGTTIFPQTMLVDYVRAYERRP